MSSVPQLRVLVYEEDGEWLAHLLEMDLVGAGSTEDAALAELSSALEAQMTFCIQENVNPFTPAPAEFFQRWEDAQRSEIESFIHPRPDYRAPARTSYVSPPDRSSILRDGWMANACPS
jgi:predicted RNase H-like HicB family nuclease